MVNRYADHTPGSIPALIAQFLMMQDTKEKGERKQRAEHFKMKGGLQAVRGTSGEKKRSQRFRQTLQTGTLPGVFQEMYLNVFC